MKLARVKYGKALARVERDLNSVIDAVNGNRIASAPGYRVKRTAHGTGLEIDMGQAAEAEPSTSTGTRMKIITVAGDYLTARKQMEDASVDNNSALLYIAKPHFLRVSTLNALVLDGWTISISDPGNTRNLTAGTGSGVTAGLVIQQKLNYPYSVGDTIYAIQPEGKTSVNHPTIAGRRLDWLDMNVDARNFHQIRIMLNACVLVGGVPTTKTIVFEAGPVP